MTVLMSAKSKSCLFTHNFINYISLNIILCACVRMKRLALIVNTLVRLKNVQGIDRKYHDLRRARTTMMFLVTNSCHFTFIAYQFHIRLMTKPLYAMCLFVCLFWFNVAFNNFSVILRRCLVATGRSILTFIVLPQRYPAPVT